MCVPYDICACTLSMSFCACILSRRAAHDLSDGTLASVPSRAALVQQNLFAGPSRGPLQVCQACFSWPHRVPYCHHYGCHLTIAGIKHIAQAHGEHTPPMGLGNHGNRDSNFFGVGRPNPEMIRAPREGTYPGKWHPADENGCHVLGPDGGDCDPNQGK